MRDVGFKGLDRMPPKIYGLDARQPWRAEAGALLFGFFEQSAGMATGPTSSGVDAQESALVLLERPIEELIDTSIEGVEEDDTIHLGVEFTPAEGGPCRLVAGAMCDDDDIPKVVYPARHGVTESGGDVFSQQTVQPLPRKSGFEEAPRATTPLPPCELRNDKKSVGPSAIVGGVEAPSPFGDILSSTTDFARHAEDANTSVPSMKEENEVDRLPRIEMLGGVHHHHGGLTREPVYGQALAGTERPGEGSSHGPRLLGVRGGMNWSWVCSEAERCRAEGDYRNQLVHEGGTQRLK